MTKKEDSFESMSTELDEIVDSLQSGELSIDEALIKYERGAELVKLLEKYLKEAENKITKIKSSLE